MFVKMFKRGSMQNKLVKQKHESLRTTSEERQLGKCTNSWHSVFVSLAVWTFSHIHERV